MAYYTCPYCGHRGNRTTSDTEHIVSRKVSEQRRQFPLARGHERGIYEVLPDTCEWSIYLPLPQIVKQY